MVFSSLKDSAHMIRRSASSESESASSGAASLSMRLTWKHQHDASRLLTTRHCSDRAETMRPKAAAQTAPGPSIQKMLCSISMALKAGNLTRSTKAPSRNVACTASVRLCAHRLDRLQRSPGRLESPRPGRRP